ncbi:hypothetical protein RJ641_020953 [Dillenia turbinata]|uniref:Bicarbonate transporter-like transmembrane domain-containing protein n=1 Tax=Dillenia turbinata TaxID=194707 RepID=A0AAN8UPD1_9MAGN
MLNVPVLYILGAFIRATMIAVIYYFDHSVASQLAQQKEFNLRKPPAFNYDLLLLGFMANGVILVSPMHAKSLPTLKHQQQLKNVRVKIQAWNKYMKAWKMPINRCRVHCSIKNLHLGYELGLLYIHGLKQLKDSTTQLASDMRKLHTPVDGKVFDIEEIDDLLPVEVKEQQLSNLLQSTMGGGCVVAMPIIKRIPTSVLWATSLLWPLKAYLVTSFGSGFFYSLQLLVEDTSIQAHASIITLSHLLLSGSHAPFMETVPFNTIAHFMIFQITYLCICFGLKWAPIAGVLSLVMIMLLVPVRQYILPKFFEWVYLQDLDAAEYEEEPALPYEIAIFVSSWRRERSVKKKSSFKEEGEMLEAAMTRSHGEIGAYAVPR